MTTLPTSGAERILELEGELATARRTIDVLMAQLERVGATRPVESEPFATAARPSNTLEERTRERDNARVELRALRANLDEILWQRTRALAESEAQLREKTVELERQSRANAAFILVVAHELRAALTGIVGYVELLTEGRFGELPSLIARPMSSVRRNALRLKKLVDDMLDVSRIEAGRMVLRRGPVDLGEVVSDVVTELEPLARARELHVATHLEPVAPIDADRDKLHQIAVNLVHNAIRDTPEQGEIVIDVDEAPSPSPEGWVRLRVRDNGKGIAEEDRKRIFDPFLHVQPAKHHRSAGPDAAGLGLYIARGLIDLHGGSITVDSQPDVFTEFTVLLPFRQDEPREDDPPDRG
jgi:two-component system, sensor histidine kinase ChiS